MKNNLETLQQYVQKSKLFLLPLLNLPKTPEVIETYLGVKGLEICDGYTLVALYHNGSENYAENFKNISSNKFFDFYVKDEEFDIVFFDLSSIPEEYTHVLNGDYSKLSKTAKILINYNNGKNELAMMGINPEYYYKELAELLEFPEENLKNKEIISKPDMDNELLNVSKEIFTKLTEDFKIPLTLEATSCS